MRVIVTKPGGFRGKDNDSPRCIHYPEGKEIDGAIAETALRENWATRVADKKPEEPAPRAAPVAGARRAPADKAVRGAPESK